MTRYNSALKQGCSNLEYLSLYDIVFILGASSYGTSD